MESTLSIILSLLATQFKTEYDVVSGMLDSLSTPRTVTIRMVQEGGSGGDIATTAAKDTAAVDASYAGMATNVGQATSRVAQETKSNMGAAGGALGNFSRAGSSAASEADGFFSHTGASLGKLTGPLQGILPMAAAVGFGALIYGSTNTAFALKTFEQQAGTSLDIAKQWTGAANDFSVPPRALSMTLKNLGQMLNNVTDASSSSTASMQADADLTEKVTVDKEKLAISQAKLNNAIDKYGSSSTQAASAEVSVQNATQNLTDAENKLADAKTGVAGLTAKQSQALNDLNIKLTDNNGKTISSTQLMVDMANAYSNATDKQQASADISQILGARSVQLLPLLEQGGAALQDSLTKGASAYQGYTQSNVNALAQAQTNIKNIEDAVKNSLVNMAAGMTPAITWIDNNLGTIENFAKVIGGLYLMKSTWGFGKSLVTDLSNIPKDVISMLNKLPGVNIGGKGGSSSGGGIPGLSAVQEVIVQAFGPEATAVLEGRGIGGGGINPGNVAGGAGGVAAAAGTGAEVMGGGLLAAGGGMTLAIGGVLIAAQVGQGLLELKEINDKTAQINQGALDYAMQHTTQTQQMFEKTGMTAQAAWGATTLLQDAIQDGRIKTAAQLLDYINMLKGENANMLLAAQGVVHVNQAFGNAALGAYSIASGITGLGNVILGMVGQAALKKPGATNASASNLARQAMQQSASGGWVTEPVFGIGDSGTTYGFAEGGQPEYIGPVGNSRGSSGGTTFVLQMSGTNVFKTSDLDNLVQLLGPRIVQMLAQAGTQPRFKR